jgi:hypothetical protein
MNAVNRLNFDATLLDTLSEGVILLNHQAQVIAHNQAAQPWLKQAAARSGVLKDLVVLEARSRVKLPLKLGVWHLKTEHKETSAQVWLIMNGRREYAIYIASYIDSTGPELQFESTPAADSRFLLLLSDEVRAHLTALQLLLSPQAGTSMRDGAAIAAQSQRVLTLLQQLTDLSLLSQRDEVFADERLDLATLIQSGFPAASVTPDQARFELTQESVGLGAVYGHGVWLSYALRVLLDALQQSAPPRSLVKVHLHQLGDHVVISARVTTDTNRRKSQLQTTDTASVSTGTADADPQSTQSQDAHVRWLICRRILTLHGGQLKLQALPFGAKDDPTNPPVDSFTLTLMTGLPLHERSRASCSSCPHVLQVQVYAEDMAQLLTPS